MLNELSINRWQQLWQSANDDATWKAFYDDEDTTRSKSVPELLELLGRFLSSKISLEQFRAEFDQRTRTEWKVFGLKGLSGAMFLNMLTKYVPDRDAITRQLQVVLPVPNDEQEAKRRLSEFVGYLNGVIEGSFLCERLVAHATDRAMACFLSIRSPGTGARIRLQHNR